MLLCTMVSNSVTLHDPATPDMGQYHGGAVSAWGLSGMGHPRRINLYYFVLLFVTKNVEFATFTQTVMIRTVLLNTGSSPSIE